MRRTVVGAFAIALLLLTGCQGQTLSEEGEPLTVEQSELLGQARFQVLSRGDTVLEIQTPAADGAGRTSFDLTLDPAAHAAWGTMTTTDAAGAETEDQVALNPDFFATLRNGQWDAVPFDLGPSRSLAVIFALGADRPENAQLLRQSNARYLGTLDVDGADQQVFRIPSSDEASSAATRLWLDADGRLRRLDLGDDDGLVILLTDREPQPEPPGVFESGASDG